MQKYLHVLDQNRGGFEPYATMIPHDQGDYYLASEADTRIAELEGALQKISQWSKAYPLDVFPEPDFKKVHEVLSAAGLSLDRVSASNMRHVITQVQQIADSAISL